MSVHRVDIDNLQGSSNSSGSTGVKKAQEDGGATNGQNGTTNVCVDGVGAKILHTFYLGLSFFLSRSSILSTLFLLCSYPIRWFPVPSVIAPSPRSPILSGTCQCTRRPGLGLQFFFLVQDDGETVLLRRLWVEVPPPAQHAEALGHAQDPGQGASLQN